MLSLTPTPTGQPTAGPGDRRPDRVSVAPSAALGLAFLGLLLALGPVASSVDGLAGGTAVLAGLIGAAAAFGTLTLGELAVARRAERLGLHRPRVVLTGWGPTLQGASAPATWQQARSLGRAKPTALAGGLLLLLLLTGIVAASALPPLAAALGGASVVTAAMLLADLLPGPDRSGGLLVLARAWRRGDRSSAQLTVARAGVRAGWAMVVVGLLSILLVGLIGLWIAFVGWLLLMSGRVAQVRASFLRSAALVPVTDAMTSGVPEVPGWRTVAAALDEVVLPARRQVFPVRRFDGTVDSVVLLADLAAVPGDDRDVRRAQDLARPAVVLRPGDRMDALLGPEAATAVASPPSGFGVVLGEAGEVLGVLGPEELSRTVAMAALHHGAGPARGADAAPTWGWVKRLGR